MYIGDANIRTNKRLLQLICVLHKDCLTKFTSSAMVERATLGLLIRSQTALTEITVPDMDANGSGATPGTAYLQGNLQKLQRLHIGVSSSNITYEHWFRYTPALRSLTLSQSKSESYAELRLWKPSDVPAPLLLKRLTLKKLSLPLNSSPLGRLLDLRVLKHLKISDCLDIGPILFALARNFSKMENTALTQLSITSDRMDEVWFKELGVLLSSFKGLETLFVSSMSPVRLNVGAIRFHGKTLRDLHVDMLNDDELQRENGDMHLYTADELKCLVDDCVHLEHLGIALVEIEFLTNEPYKEFKLYPTPYRSYVGTALATALVSASRESI